MIQAISEPRSYEYRRRFKHVYQFRITLNQTQPPVWRRIQVPETYSFWDLHVAISDCMPWDDCHEHLFTVKNPTIVADEEIGIPNEDRAEDEPEVAPGWEVDMAPFFTFRYPAARYVYDFGDNWEHTVRLEKIFPREKEVAYPRCIGGRRACPPEDCGGISGYAELLAIIRDPSHKDYRETLEWLGGEFDPESFAPESVRFDDPDKRWEIAFGG
ncbi:MAG: plasmid pRiA4b ORF-3 family protein [Kiritimatiellae bacterium]|nr:plasmid pRiA4b ORF-3 family protein [Kiritimatiellia bacterium]